VYVNLTEILCDADARERLAATFRRFVAEFDPEVRHVIFGSDCLTAFLRTQCKLESAAIGRILRDNR
jgi:hypothetical protein